MKIKVVPVLLLVLIGSALYAKNKNVQVVDYQVTMTGGTGSYQEGGCWLHVSDGQTLYVLASTEPGFHPPNGVGSQNCQLFPVGSHVPGAIISNGRYMNLGITDKKGKVKAKTFKIVSTSDAKMTQ